MKKKLLLLCSLGMLAMGTPVWADSQAELKIIELLKQIRDGQGAGGGGGGGDASAAKQDIGNASLGSIDTKLSSQGTAANQTAVQANAGSDATKAMAVQGVTGGKALPVSPNGGAVTDRSGTITTGGTSQQISAVNGSRHYFEYQNISDETQYINFGVAATVDSNSFKIVAGGSWVNTATFCPTGTINVIGATTGKKFVAKEG